MVDPVAFAQINALVLGSGLVLAFLFGAIAQRTHFCSMGAISDVIHMGDWGRARQFILAMGVAMVGFGALSATHLINPSDALYATVRWSWLSTIVGGLMFGWGMVYASGCGSKTLVRAGAGNLKSWVVILVMGISAFATLKGLTAVWRTRSIDGFFLHLEPQANLGHWLGRALGMDAASTTVVLGLLLGMGLIGWAMRSGEFRTRHNLLAGLGMGALVVAMWWTTGHLGHVDEHPLTLESVYVASNSGRMEAFSFVAPMAYLLDYFMFYSDASKVLTLGVVVPLGVMLGSCFTALITRSFRWEGFGGVDDLGRHLLGGVLMGVGGVTAMGCSIGHGLSGMSTLALNSFSALAFLVLGAVLALRHQIRLLERGG
jgi:uncharacterized membrane protein YedE/YeeE